MVDRLRLKPAVPLTLPEGRRSLSEGAMPLLARGRLRLGQAAALWSCQALGRRQEAPSPLKAVQACRKEDRWACSPEMALVVERSLLAGLLCFSRDRASTTSQARLTLGAAVAAGVDQRPWEPVPALREKVAPWPSTQAQQRPETLGRCSCPLDRRLAKGKAAPWKCSQALCIQRRRMLARAATAGREEPPVFLPERPTTDREAT